MTGIHVQPAAQHGAPLKLDCRARRASFEDGSFFRGFRSTITIDPAHGWRLDFDQFVRRFPRGVTVVITSESGNFRRFDRSSHMQTGSCRTLLSPRFPEWPFPAWRTD